MQVKELIEQLKYMDQDAEVHFAYNYGDHWRTEVAPKVSQVSEVITWKSVSKGDYKIDVRKVVVID